jgi:hypothetical protein
LDGEAEDWLDAPVLLISGEGDPGFSPMELSKLKVFMEKGGLVFSVSLGGDAAFTAAMERYASAVVAGKYEGRRLPADHPLFTLNQKVENPPALWAISNGLRELWVHCPEYIGGALPVNLYVYVTGKGRPRNRLETLRVRMPEDVAGKRVINLACVEFAGQTDSEPAAWPRLAAMMPAETNFLVKVTQVPLLKLDAHDTPVAHMTGLEKFELSAEERQQLQTYLDSGGTVIADAAGGSEAFAGSFESMVGALKGPQKGGVVGGAQAFLARAQAQMAAVGRFRKSTPPARRTADGSEVEVWRMGDREAIYFFPLDVTSGLLGTETWGISGYTPETSQVLARDLLLYATRTAPGSTSR